MGLMTKAMGMANAGNDKARQADTAKALVPAKKKARAKLGKLHSWGSGDYGRLGHGDNLNQKLPKAVDVAVQGKSREEKYTCLSDIGSLLQDMGKLEDAEPLLRRALEGREATLGKSHPDTLASIGNLATLLKAMGKLEDAEALLRRGKK